MKFVLCLSLLALIALPAAADVNVTGNWTGTFAPVGPDGQSEDGPALLILKQNGNEITGTVGPNEDKRFNIVKGSIDGNKIVLEVAEGDHQLHFDLVLTEDRIQGEGHASIEGEERHAKLDVKRAK